MSEIMLKLSLTNIARLKQHRVQYSIIVVVRLDRNSNSSSIRLASHRRRQESNTTFIETVITAPLGTLHVNCEK